MELGAAYALANSLVAEHGLDGWRVVYDRAKTRAGVCRPAQREIGLSAPLTRLHDEAEVRETVLHEIAHALVGPRHGHDAVWKAAARRIGCTGERCLSPEAPRVDAPWIGTCPGGHTVQRHRRPERVYFCGRCKGDPANRLLDWRHRGRQVAMHPNYLAEFEQIAGARPARPIPVGARVRLRAPGRYDGMVGRVVKRGRTRFHVQVAEGVLTVPFAMVEPA